MLGMPLAPASTITATGAGTLLSQGTTAALLQLHPTGAPDKALLPARMFVYSLGPNPTAMGDEFTSNTFGRFWFPENSRTDIRFLYDLAGVGRGREKVEEPF